jgi:hypothetical protein
VVPLSQPSPNRSLDHVDLSSGLTQPWALEM